MAAAPLRTAASADSASPDSSASRNSSAAAEISPARFDQRWGFPSANRRTSRTSEGVFAGAPPSARSNRRSGGMRTRRISSGREEAICAGGMAITSSTERQGIRDRTSRTPPRAAAATSAPLPEPSCSAQCAARASEMTSPSATFRRATAQTARTARTQAAALPPSPSLRPRTARSSSNTMRTATGSSQNARASSAARAANRSSGGGDPPSQAMPVGE